MWWHLAHILWLVLRPSRQLVILGQLSAGISTPQSYEKQKMHFSYRTINMLIAALKMGILIGLKRLHLIELLFGFFFLILTGSGLGFVSNLLSLLITAHNSAYCFVYCIYCILVCSTSTVVLCWVRLGTLIFYLIPDLICEGWRRKHM